MAKNVLDTDAMSHGFFEDAAMIGIASAQPGYRFCWMLNKHLDIEFFRDPEQDLSMKKKDKQKNETDYRFPVYQYNLPNSDHKYFLYKLKDGAESLLPETKHIDYLLLVHTANSDADAILIANELRNIPDVQLAQILLPDQLKNMNNLLL